MIEKVKIITNAPFNEELLQTKIYTQMHFNKNHSIVFIYLKAQISCYNSHSQSTPIPILLDDAIVNAGC